MSLLAGTWKTRRPVRRWLAAVASLALATACHAAQIASDPFNYTAPGGLNTQTGGTGFGSFPWAAVSGQTDPATASGSMSYSDGTSSILVSGNKLTPAINSRSTRNFGSLITTANQTYWLSFRANQTGAGTLPTNHAGFSLFSGTSGSGTEIMVGKPGNATNWGMWHSTGGVMAQRTGDVTVTGGRDAFLVYKLKFTATQVTISMWVNPVLTEEGPVGNPHATLTANHNQMLASMRISTGANSANYQFDEFRMGTEFWDVAPTGNTHTPTTNAQFYTALNNAALGDRIILTAGQDYQGNAVNNWFTMPNKTTGSGWITIRSSAQSSLPGPGVRISPANAANMPKISTSGSNIPALKTALSSHHFRIVGVEFVGPPSGGMQELLQLGQNTTAQNSLSLVPHHFVIDRCIVRPAFAGQAIVRGVGLHSKDTDIINSYIADFASTSVDAQAIGGVNGPGPFNIINNYLVATGENILFGGDDPKITNLVPSNIVVKGNYMTKKLTWNKWRTTANGFTTDLWDGQPWFVKNIFELKNARYVTLEGNIFENNWGGMGQSGWGIVFTPRNQGGSSPWTIVADVTMRKNIFRHSGGGINILGYDDSATSQQTNNIVIEHNLMYDIAKAGWQDPAGSGGDLFQIYRGASNVKVEHNTAFATRTIITTDVPAYTNPGLIYRNNVQAHNTYGVKGGGQSSGNTTLNTYFPSATYVRNVMVNTNSVSGLTTAYNLFPQGFTSPATTFPALWTDVVTDPVNPGTNYVNFKVKAAYQNTATDGTDVGANIDDIVAATAGTISGVWP